MLNYTSLYKKAYAGNIQGFNIPNGRSKHDTDEDAITADDIFSHLNESNNTVGTDKEAVNVLTDADAAANNDAATSANLTEDTSSYTAKTASSYDDKNTVYTPYNPSDPSAVRTDALSRSDVVEKLGEQSKGFLSKLDGLFNTKNLGKVDDFAKKLMFNSPLVRAGLLGTAGWFAGRYATPWVFNTANKILPWSVLPKIDKDAYGRPILNEEDAKWAGGLTAAALGLASLIPEFDTKRPWWGFKTFRKKSSADVPYTYSMYKKANMYGMMPVGMPPPTMGMMPALPYMNAMNNPYMQPALPLGTAREMIAGNATMSPATRMGAMDVLNAMPNQDPAAPVTGSSIIDTAVKNGLSALGDAAIGYVTANALGLSNPAGIARMTGATSFILRDLM